LISAVWLALLVAGCGGGGGGPEPVGHVEGTLVDAFGAPISHSSASVSLEGTSVAGSPELNGHFKLDAEPGTYTLVGVWSDTEAGIRLVGKRELTVVVDQTVQVGEFELTNIDLMEGWARYGQGKYYQAEQYFLDYLDTIRSAQADVGSASVYSALGWTRGQGQNRPDDAIADFNKALGGWDGNVDALVGLAGCQLSRMKSGGEFHFQEAVEAINSAIEASGEYNSAPTHDMVNESDLKAFRVLVNYLNGDVDGAGSEAEAIEAEVDSLGNFASKDALEVILAFTE
jgi:tetratricopeptide (TPR) repeat protein